MNAKTNRVRLGFVVGLLVLGAAAGQAVALTLDGSGNVVDWGITPFPQTGSAAGNHAGWGPSFGVQPHTWWIEENNYTHVNYPSLGHVPSPGGQAGEVFDQSFLGWRFSGDNLQVLLGHSMGDAVYYSGWHRYYRIGDLFIDVDDGGYDYAIASTNTTEGGQQAWERYDPSTRTYSPLNHSAAPGTFYPVTSNDQLVTIVGIQYGGYGDNSYVEGITRPWVIDEDLAASDGTVTLQKASFSYGDRKGGGFYPDDPNKPSGGITLNEDDTWFFEYTIPLSMLGIDTDYDLENLGLHVATECGNDFISNYDEWTEHTFPIPEPVSVLAVGLGLMALGRYWMRRQRAAA